MLRLKTTELISGYKELRCLQLYLGLVNVVNKNLIFVWKMLSLGTTIGSGYAAIAHLKDRPVFGIMYCTIFCDCAIVYCFLYGKAFEIPNLFQRAQELLLFRVRQNGGAKPRMDTLIMLRRIRAVQPGGIKVGEFHMMERTSTPVFLHYVSTNVVSMLLAYN